MSAHKDRLATVKCPDGAKVIIYRSEKGYALVFSGHATNCPDDTALAHFLVGFIKGDVPHAG